MGLKQDFQLSQFKALNTQGPTQMETRIIVDGDAEKGWMVEIHDGARCETYSPTAATEDGAIEAALALFNAPPPPPAPVAETGAYAHADVHPEVQTTLDHHAGLLASFEERIKAVEAWMHWSTTPVAAPANDQETAHDAG